MLQQIFDLVIAELFLNNIYLFLRDIFPSISHDVERASIYIGALGWFVAGIVPNMQSRTDLKEEEVPIVIPEPVAGPSKPRYPRLWVPRYLLAGLLLHFFHDSIEPRNIGNGPHDKLSSCLLSNFAFDAKPT